MAALEKARFYDPAASANAIYVQFNPNTLEYSYARSPHRGNGKKKGKKDRQQSPLGVWERATLSMTLFFNTYRSETSYSDVRNRILPVRNFLCTTNKKGKAKVRSVVFAWGTLTFQGTMDSFSMTYQMFAADGTPVQAEAKVSLTGEDAQVIEGPVYGEENAGEDAVEDLSWLFEEETG